MMVGRFYSLAETVRGALRSVMRTRAFVATAALTLALGIGLATAVFTVADALLLRQLPVTDQDGIVLLWGETRDGSFSNYPLSVDGARDFALRTRNLERTAFLASFGAAPSPVVDGDQVTRVRRSLVSGLFFDVLDARPALGRTLRAADDLIGAAPVAVLSYSAWQQRFGSDPQILGRQIRMYQNDLVYTVVGVMGRGLDYPRGVEFWAPLLPSFPAEQLPLLGVHVVGRVRPGATAEQARAELNSFYQRPEAASWESQLRGVVHTLPRLVLGDTRPAVIIFALASALLLLITCSNVASLLIVRGMARRRELTVRSALGASRRQIAAQLFIENGLLALTGGSLGTIIAAVCVKAFVVLAPPEIPRLDEIHINVTALLAASALTCIALLIFGLTPALTSARVELQRVLRTGTRVSETRRARLGLEALVAGQIAIALVILAASALIAQTLLRLERAELAFDPAGLLIGELALRTDQYESTSSQMQLLERLQQKLASLPEVAAVSPVVAVPFSGGSGWDGRLAREGQTPEQASANPMLNMEVVAPQYFPTMGISVQRGRAFTDADRERARAVVMISQSAAAFYWPGADPIGRQLRMGRDLERSFTVVGVVPDTRYRDLRSARPSVYFPMRQSFFPFAPLALAIRTKGLPDHTISLIRHTIAENEAGVALASLAPFEAFLSRPLAQPRLNALLLAVFAAAAAALSALGLFSVLATMVHQRRHDFGVRMALGASATDLQRLVVQRGLTIALTGVGLGLVSALAGNRLLATLLYEVSPVDTLAYAGVAGFMLCTATLASLIPARAATRSQPLSALRS